MCNNYLACKYCVVLWPLSFSLIKNFGPFHKFADQNVEYFSASNRGCKHGLPYYWPGTKETWTQSGPACLLCKKHRSDVGRRRQVGEAPKGVGENPTIPARPGRHQNSEQTRCFQVCLQGVVHQKAQFDPTRFLSKQLEVYIYIQYIVTKRPTTPPNAPRTPSWSSNPRTGSVRSESFRKLRPEGLGCTAEPHS